MSKKFHLSACIRNLHVLVLEKELQHFSVNTEAFEQLSNFIEENCTSLLEHCHTANDRILLLRQLGSYLMLLVHILKLTNKYAIECDSSR